MGISIGRNIMRVWQVRSVCIAVLLLAGGLLAQIRHQAGTDAFKSFLNLSADQAASVDQEVTTMQQRCDTLVADLEQVRARSEEAMAAGDSELIGKLTLQAKSIEDQVSAERLAYRDRVQGVLTPAQAERLKLAQEVLQMLRDNPGAVEPLLVDGLRMKEYHPGGLLLRHTPEQVHVRKSR
jgi:hypothetical protein